MSFEVKKPNFVGEMKEFLTDPWKFMQDFNFDHRNGL